MSSVLRSVRKRKKGRTLGAVDVIDREGYAELEVDAKVELIRPSPPSSRSSMSWRIGTNRRPAVWRKAWTRP